ncbi:adaptor protein MecA [Filibacter tadaridae]|uniref:Adapter protein MecA n=1 Tax=Filibacter tadaridae TaxID=2483811 RepID=A0A3P5X9H7_9BACL|nr:adaptor protein MecA [Filibacter tadaridae]VDC27500.1 Adapter protein MecA 1 [Filibacter tadaridae]
MEIERINENTVKFFLSYIDIEERGFTREEVWYNRDKSEELFWEMMDEVNDEAEFEVEGPLWIQVHAMSGGIEVTVTRAQLSPEGDPLDSPFGPEDTKRMFQPSSSVFEDDETSMQETDEKTFEWLENMFVFPEFDDLIALASRVMGYEVGTSLHSYEGKYYLHMTFNPELMDDSRKTDLFSVLSEYGTPSNMTIHRIEEYGTVIMDSDVFTNVQYYFGK